jgi:hypothetical protein
VKGCIGAPLWRSVEGLQKGYRGAAEGLRGVAGAGRQAAGQTSIVTVETVSGSKYHILSLLSCWKPATKEPVHGLSFPI